MCGCALLLLCGVAFSFCGTLCWAECCGRSRVDVLLVFPFLGMLCWVECCVGSRVDVGCLPVSCWLFLACCIVVFVVSVDRFVIMLDIWRVCQLFCLVLFICTYVFGGFMDWRGADHLVGVAYRLWCVITVAIIRITVCCSQLSFVLCVAYLLFVNCSCSRSGSRLVVG